MGKRTKMIEFRKSLGFTTEEISQKLNVSESYYNLIENGQRDGSIEFWYRFQDVFGIRDYDFWELVKIERSE